MVPWLLIRIAIQSRTKWHACRARTRGDGDRGPRRRPGRRTAARTVYVVEGQAGTGKTTLALQFLLAGRDNNEPCLLVTTTETRDDLTAVAHSHGWSLAGIEILELSLTDPIAQPEQRQTLFRPSHVELDETMQAVLAELERVQPVRVVLDSVSMLRIDG